MSEAFDARDNWTPATPAIELGLGQQPGTPDPQPAPASGDQPYDNR